MKKLNDAQNMETILSRDDSLMQMEAFDGFFLYISRQLNHTFSQHSSISKKVSIPAFIAEVHYVMRKNRLVKRERETQTDA